MRLGQKGFVRSVWLLLPGIGLIFLVPVVNAQTTASSSRQAAIASPSANNRLSTKLPLIKDYRGVHIGMSATDVRSKLDRLKKDKALDVYVRSDKESAQIYYDPTGKVMAISVDYFGDDSNAPSASDVLGVTPKEKGDGSLYQLNRYPEAGYWVSYNRTAGENPIITITMQKM